MSVTAIADLVCAIFLGILFSRHFADRGLSKSNWILNVCLLVMFFTLLIDAAAYTFIGPAYSLPVRYVLNFLSFVATCVNVILFTLYMQALFSENAKVNPWIFRVALIVEFIWMFSTTYEFIAGRLLTYDASGIENLDYVVPTFIVVLNLAIQIYLLVITIANSRKIGKGMALLLALFFIIPILASIFFSFAGIDFAYALGAVMLGLVAEFVQRKQAQTHRQEQLVTQTLATQQRYLKSFGEMVNAALWRIFIDERNEVTGVDWSDEIRRMLGLTAEEYPNTLDAWFERLHSDDREKTQEAFEQGLDTEDTENYVYDLEYRLRKKSGEYCWYHALGRMEYNDDGTRTLYGIIYDMTVDKQLEEKQGQLEESLTFTNFFLDTYVSAYYINLNDSSYQVYKRPKEQDESYPVIGDYYESLKAYVDNEVHPDDRGEVLGILTPGNIRRVLKEAPEYTHFFKAVSGGRERAVRVQIIRGADENHAAIGFSDVTEDLAEQQKHLLGAVPLSPDVLNKANIGLWSFEMDEGKPPRMYGDETMIKLVGLDHQVEPEEMYHAWYDHIDEDSYGLVAEAVDKMMTEHAEVQYPWHHPDGHTMIVRCGGVRNPEYTQGIRIEGTHQDVSQTLHYDEKTARHQQLELEASNVRAEMLAFISDHEPDVDKFMEFFGKRVIEVMGCDQVIFRNMEGHRTVVDAEGIEDVPQSICAQCAFSQFEGDGYGDGGIVLMSDCAQGFNGVMTHPQCPAKSSFMQKVYSDDRLAGLLSIHYLKEYHEFTENDIDIMKTVGAHLGLLLMRIDAKKSELERLRAESANKAKTNFLFNMSHDIRTPMNAITGFIEKALRHKDDVSVLEESLEKARTSSEYLLRIINDILDMARIESGKIELNEQLNDVEDGNKIVLEMFGSEAARKGIEFHTAFDIVDRYLWFDGDRTLQIIANLLSNAIKYTDAGGDVWYAVVQVPCDKDGYGEYRITVKDSGKGMSPEFLEKVFDAFERDQSAIANGAQGTGLGMSIVKSLVDAMGSTIDIRSELGCGTTVTVTSIHRIASEEEVERFLAERAEKGNAAQADFSGRRALLVEDNELNREIALDILEEEGLLVEEAEDGSVAVEMLREKDPDYFDFILMDIQMPVMDGYAATKAIRELPGGKDVPIIALSANAFEEDRQKSLDAGMNAHVAKPIDINELFAVLARFL